MREEDLKEYVPKKGDRVKLRKFCKKSTDSDNRRKPLLAKLRSKLLQETADYEEGESSSKSKRARLGNSNAKKSTRKVEVGWLICDGNVRKQIKITSGGGTRKVEVPKNATKKELEPLAIDLFFPKDSDGIRRSRHHGLLSDFETDMRDYEQGPLLGTVGEMYEKTGFSMLRLYLLCTRKFETTAAIGTESEDLERKQGKVKVKEAAEVSLDKEDLEVRERSPESKIKQDIINLEGEVKEGDEVSLDKEDLEVRERSSESKIGQDNRNLKDEQTQEIVDISENFMVVETSITPEPVPSGELGVDNVACLQVLDTMGTVCLQDNMFAYDLSDSEIQFRLTETGARKENTVLNVELKRGNVMEDLINWMVLNDQKVELGFTKLEVTLLRTNGKKETGEDNGGVLRDSLSEFWADFYLKYTCGDLTKVPEVVHTMGEQRWRAVAKILVLGFLQVGYYPVQLAEPFIMNCIYETFNENSLIENFLSFMSGSDRDVIKRAMNDFASVNEDELLDALEDYKVKRLVTKDNFCAIVNEIAHTKLIQEPAFISEIWREVLTVHLKPNIGDKEALKAMYEKLVPTNRRIVEILNFTTQSSQEECLAQWLKRLIKNFSEEKCRKFLRFCTGKFYQTIVLQSRVDSRSPYSIRVMKILTRFFGAAEEGPTWTPKVLVNIFIKIF